MPAETNASTAKPKGPARPRFWVGPLVAGACFALGYGITQRVVLIRSGLEQAEPQSFKARAFPGESLEALRLRHGETGTLEADVAAKELIDAKASKQAKLAKELEQRKAKEEAERIAAAAIEDDRSQQAALNTPLPFEGMPSLNETTLFETDAPTELLDSELLLEAPNPLQNEGPELAQPTPTAIEPASAATDLFFTPIEAPPAP
ncbi:putative conserved membrane protein [Synechococcus sp. PROS-9-1]|uniref:hypothetical protein n=1 Tax=Synechococcus sp. PROS-9-1 TaxID=1968775 RepID=UPI0016469828|nr:hypothetical protein [Synechococcus sp. PROS-9-1]QNJ33003.1 putative conserved membrane protein [Synechococcus sp. PROS-9-1]